MSEHFLNVDVLLSQLRAGSVAIAKKKAPEVAKSRLSTDPPAPASPASPADNREPANSPVQCDIQLIKDKWQDILSLVSSKLGPGTGSLLSCAVPGCFENGVLVLEFAAPDKGKADICESNGRPEQIEALLSEEFSTSIRVKFEVAGGSQTKADSKADQQKTGSQRRNELLNDPAVKAVLMGLDATITGVEEKQ